jgi:uncharacterized protein
MLNSNRMAEEIEAAQSAHWGFWGTIIWGAVILVIFELLELITVFVLAIAGYSAAGKSSRPTFEQAFISVAHSGFAFAAETIVTSVVCGGLVVWVIKLKKGSVLREYLCINSVALTAMRNWLGPLVCLLVVKDVTMIVAGHSAVSEFASLEYATAKPVWLFWIAMVIAAPLFEEVFFRGFLFKGLGESFMGLGPIGAVFVTSGLWAALHLQYDSSRMTIIFLFGLLFGAARIVTGSLLVPLALHATMNAIATAEVVILG